MSRKNVQSTHIVASLPDFHRSLIEIVSVMNRPERDGEMLALAGLSLERALFPLIVLIERLGPIGVVDLAGRVGRDYTTVSRQVARLEELGLASRRTGQTDRRVREAVITPSGRAATEAVDRARGRMAVALFREWSRSDFDELLRVMRKLADDMSRDPGSPHRRMPAAIAVSLSETCRTTHHQSRLDRVRRRDV